MTDTSLTLLAASLSAAAVAQCSKREMLGPGPKRASSGAQRPPRMLASPGATEAGGQPVWQGTLREEGGEGGVHLSANHDRSLAENHGQRLAHAPLPH